MCCQFQSAQAETNLLSILEEHTVVLKSDDVSPLGQGQQEPGDTELKAQSVLLFFV